MSNIEIIKVTTKEERKLFARFGNKLYEGNEYYVPDLEMDILDTFNPKKNAAYEFCESQLFLAKKAGEVVGRVAAMINHRANETWDVKNVRFGYLDFIDDKDVSAALLNAVEDWGRQRGMNNCQGPMGFTDFDKEGMLTEGFDELGTMITFYNHAYYLDHMDAMGYEKEVDWVEIRARVPEQVPDRFLRVGEMVSKRLNLHIAKHTKQELLDYAALEIFHLMNEAYAPLFGFSKLSDRQIDQLVNSYIKLVDPRLISIVENENNEVVCAGITIPSMSKALQRTKGKIFPFGWWHLLKALKFKRDDTVDMMLIAVKPELQGKGVNALLFCDLIPVFNEYGFKWALTGPQLEYNHKELNQWDIFNPE